LKDNSNSLICHQRNVLYAMIPVYVIDVFSARSERNN
jgi:hypothetical protein